MDVDRMAPSGDRIGEVDCLKVFLTCKGVGTENTSCLANAGHRSRGYEFRVLESRYIFPQQFRVSVGVLTQKAFHLSGNAVVGHVCEMAGHVHEHNTVGEYAAIPWTAEHRNIFRALLAQFCE